MKSFKELALECFRHNSEIAESQRAELDAIDHRHTWICNIHCPIRDYDALLDQIAAYNLVERALLSGDCKPAIEALSHIAEQLEETRLRRFILPFLDASVMLHSARRQILRQGILELIAGLKKEME